MKIWGTETYRTLRPIWVAEELGLEYELIRMGPRTGETQTDAFTHLTPKQKIPLYRDDDVCLSESVAICRYLITREKRASLLKPDTTNVAARLDEWCCYIYGELDETSLYVMRRHGDLAHIYGPAPTAVTAAGEYAERHLGIVAGLLGDREFLMSEGFSLADILLVTCLDWALRYQLTVPETLCQYSRKITQRPAYQRAVAVNFGENG